MDIRIRSAALIKFAMAQRAMRSERRPVEEGEVAGGGRGGAEGEADAGPRNEVDGTSIVLWIDL